MLVALAVMVSSRNAAREQALLVDLSGPVVTAAPASRVPLRFALTAVASPERNDRHFALADYLSSQLDQPVNLVERHTHAEIVELLRHDAIHAGIVCTGAFLHARRTGVAIDVIAVPVHEAGPFTNAVILVRSEAPARDFMDLAGGAFAYNDPLSLGGYAYPQSLLIRAGHDPATFFARSIFTYSDEGSIRAILDGIVDGAAVDRLVYERELRRDPGLGARVRVVHESPPFGVSPVVVPTGMDASLRDRLRRVILALGTTPDGKAALASLGFVRFEEPPPGLYDSAVEIVQTVEKYDQSHQRRADRGAP